MTGGEPPFGVHRRLRSVDTLAVEIERKGERLLKTCDLR